MAPVIRRFLMGVLGFGVLGALGWIALRSEPEPVDLAAIVMAPMVVTVDAEGRTRIRDVFEVAAPIAGTARRAPVEVGDQVTEGDTIVAVVEPAAPALLDARAREQAEAAVREARAALTLAEAQFRQAEEELRYAQTQHDRARTLTERGVATLTALEDASQLLSIRLAAREAARSNVEMATSALARIQAALIAPGVPGSARDSCCVTIRAPISGTVLSVAVVSETPVAAGTPLLTIGDPANLEIVADLLSSDAVGLAPGARATVERWGGPDPLDARLRSLDPSAHTRVSALGIEEQRVNAVLDLLGPPGAQSGLGDGYYVYLRIVTWETDAALQVPLAALFRHQGGWAVYRVVDDTAQLSPVTINRRNETMAEVTAGLAADDRVVLHPADRIMQGTAIVARSAQ